MNKTLFLIFALPFTIISVVVIVVTQLSPKQKIVTDQYTDQHIERRIHDYIDKNTDKIVEKLIENIRERGDGSGRIAHYKNEIFDFTYPYIGNEESNVVAVGFFDYSCGYCKTIKDNVKQLINDGKIKYIFRDAPILGDNSLKVAKSALAVYFIDREKYFDFHYAALSHKGTFSNDDILNIVRNIGINENDFYHSMENNQNKIEPMLNNSIRLIRDLGVGGIPFIVIGDSLFEGTTDLNILRKKIDAQLAK
ncbi:disulfide bond formation protein DsbA [Wolbachia pipientis]|uniref:Disulfide bond formation protein DsbA n=1 Tax=Wolbachia pipientis TaxID=955 RepID=A0A1E7QJ27_WOLPI|nr:DsbA family protein [Wolbachia pipientis]OEY86470.1 disulfide bond formation protein DsbA [Wolbachia pipientis]